MPFNAKQYIAAEPFLREFDDNVVAEWDKKRIASYDLYENLYLNSMQTLKLVIRGEEDTYLLMPNGKKIVETTNRFLGVGFDYMVEAAGDAGIQELLEDWFQKWFKRETVQTKFASNKRWGLVRGDSIFYLYGDVTKGVGERICLHEIDPRQVFLIEDPRNKMRVIGCHIVEKVPDWREQDVSKTVTKRRTFRKTLDDNGVLTGEVTTELTYWTNGKWDDRVMKSEDLEQIKGGPEEQQEEVLPPPISELPIYRWRNSPPQNSSWGISQLAGLETLFYGINQSLTDEDATIVFQGLGMYVTTAAPPLDPNSGDVTAWNIGPKQIIEVGENQRFERVTGVSDVSPFQDHMKYIDEGIGETSGTPAIAIGRVDVAIAESGISLKLQLMPLLAQNAEKELEFITVMDQMFHDVVTMWLSAYEPETFSNYVELQQCSVVCVFDDPMPVNRDAQVQETVLLDASGLILKSMVVAKLRELGWKYPTVDPFTGEALDDNAIAAMLLDQASEVAKAADPFSASMGAESVADTDEFGNPVDTGPQTVDLGVS